jgi:hypothetical protein
MRTKTRVAVVMPVGSLDDDLLDTLDSVLRYTDPDRVIVIMDDVSRTGQTLPDLTAISPDIVVFRPPPELPNGRFIPLWLKLAATYHWLLERYEPELVLRLDADALLLGPGVETLADRAFAADPDLGLLGSYRIGPDGGQRDFSWLAHQLRVLAGVRGLLHPRRRSMIRPYWRLARAQGYVDGEHILGAAVVFRCEALRAVDRNGWFTAAWPDVMLGEDHIISMLMIAAGYRIGDFSGPDDPMALKWIGLPAHPDDLLARGKLVTHSVRSWQDLNQAQIRAIFAAARSQDQPQPDLARPQPQ